MSLITLGGALLVVTTSNLFRGALYLMLSLFGVAGLFVLLTAPFLALVQVVVYVGAIALLIIFAIMLTPQVSRVAHPQNTQWIAAVVVGVIFFITLLSVVTPLADELGVDDWNAKFTEENPADVPNDSLMDLGEALVDPEQYVLPFEVASVLLMAVLVGAVLLVWPGTLRGRLSAPDAPTDDEQSGA
jgi:NADH-quinone oxidoreductase subunit J